VAPVLHFEFGKTDSYGQPEKMAEIEIPAIRS
jgi:hypothetical protein